MRVLKRKESGSGIDKKSRWACLIEAVVQYNASSLVKR